MPAVIWMALKVICFLCYRALGEPSQDHALYCTKKSKQETKQPHTLDQNTIISNEHALWNLTVQKFAPFQQQYSRKRISCLCYVEYPI